VINPDDNIVIIYTIENSKEVKTIMTTQDFNSLPPNEYQESTDEEWEAFLQRRAEEEYCY
jgi:hypothetical protein